MPAQPLTLREVLELLDGDGLILTEDWDTLAAQLPEGVTLDAPITPDTQEPRP